MVRFELTEDMTVVLAVGLAAMLVLATVAYTYTQPRPYKHFFEIYPLGPGKMAANYPTKIEVGKPTNIWLGVSNHMGRVEYVLVYVKIGANATAIPNDITLTPSPVTPYKQIEYFLMDNQTQIFPVSIAINKPGLNYNVMFELWHYNETAGGFRYAWHDGSVYRATWSQIWLNVTA